MSHAPNSRSSREASERKSLIAGAVRSVRLPMRMVPIWVRDPIGSARPFRARSAPAIIVVETAPRPGRRMASFPAAGAIASGCFTLYARSKGWASDLHSRETFARRNLGFRRKSDVGGEAARDSLGAGGGGVPVDLRQLRRRSAAGAAFERIGVGSVRFRRLDVR